MPSFDHTELIRLDKFLANHTEYSRAEIKRLLKKERVTVNQQICKDGNLKITPLIHTVTLNDQVVQYIEPLYIALHKPQNVECSATPTHYSSIYELLRTPSFDHTIAPFLIEQIRIAGRLDADTTGLVLLTNDGLWNHKVTSPKKHCIKHYEVTLENPITPDMIKALSSPMLLKNEAKPTQPATVDVISPHVIHLFIHEGKYHQVKRMLGAVGNKVTDLHRLAIGAIKLDKTLQQGQWRFLTQQEIQSI